MNQANKNFATNIVHIVANIIVGVLYTPYLVKTVGIVVYGVVPLALVINQYINVISLSLINALTRFYSVEYRGNNMEKASSYFSTSIIVGIVFSLILYPILHVGINYVRYVFDIPEALISDAQWLFRFTVASFFVSIISNCVNTTLYADNRLDDVNYLKITRQLSKFGFNIALFLLFDVNIFYIGLANLLSESLVLLLSVYFYRKTKPQGVRFSFFLYNKGLLFTMLSMIAWVLLQRFSDTFLYKIDSILMNVYFGIKMTGIIGAVSEFGSYVVSITSILASLFGPLMLIAYSKKNICEYETITVDGGYLVGLFTSLFTGLLCGSASILLSLWLGKEYGNYGSWMIIKIIVIPFTSVGAMYSNSYLYANRNKYPALVSLSLAILNILFNIVLLHFIKSVYVFMIACMIFMVMQGFLMQVYFYNSLYHGCLKKIFQTTAKFILCGFCVSITTYMFTVIFNVHSIYVLMCIYMVVACLWLILIDVWFVNNKQRDMLIKLVPVYGKIRRFITKYNQQ